jgi:hypothetical protein
MNQPSLSRLWEVGDVLRRKIRTYRQIAPPGEVKLESDCRLCRRNRQGAAAVEFAIVAPVFFLVIFGMIEFGRALMVQQVLTNASREGARVAVLDGSTSTSSKAVVTNYLTSAGVSGATIKVCNGSGAEVEPSTIGYGELVVVNVSIPFTKVSWLASPWFLGSKTLRASTVMRRETVQ